MPNKSVITTFWLDNGTSFGTGSAKYTKAETVEKLRQTMSGLEDGPLVVDCAGETAIIPLNKISMIVVKEQ